MDELLDLSLEEEELTAGNTRRPLGEKTTSTMMIESQRKSLLGGWFSTETSYKHQPGRLSRALRADVKGGAPVKIPTDARVPSDRSLRLDLAKKRSPVLMSPLPTKAGSHSYRVHHRGPGESPKNPNRSARHFDLLLPGLMGAGGYFSNSNDFAHLLNAEADLFCKTVKPPVDRSAAGLQHCSATGATSSRRLMRLIPTNPVCIQLDCRVKRKVANLSEEKRAKEAESKKRIELKRQYLRGVARWEQQEKQKRRICPRKDLQTSLTRDTLPKDRTAESSENKKVSASLSISFQKRPAISSPKINFF